jgi:hypothetical protein
MYVCMYVCMYVRMYVCMIGCEGGAVAGWDVDVIPFAHVLYEYACIMMHVCMYVCMCMCEYLYRGLHTKDQRTTSHAVHLEL